MSHQNSIHESKLPKICIHQSFLSRLKTIKIDFKHQKYEARAMVDMYGDVMSNSRESPVVTYKRVEVQPAIFLNLGRISGPFLRYLSLAADPGVVSLVMSTPITTAALCRTLALVMSATATAASLLGILTLVVSASVTTASLLWTLTSLGLENILNRGLVKAILHDSYCLGVWVRCSSRALE